MKTYMKIKFSSLNINYRCTDWTDLMVHWCPKELVSSLMPPSLLSLPWLWCWADPALNQTAPRTHQTCFWWVIKVHLPSTRSGKCQDLCQVGDGMTWLEAQRGYNRSLQPGGRNWLSCSIYHSPSQLWLPSCDQNKAEDSDQSWNLPPG